MAAYQAPFLPVGEMNVAQLIRKQIDDCETQGVQFLCCPEGVFGGLADYAPDPRAIAINVTSGDLEKVLAPLASATVTSIIGFTEIVSEGALYNAAAIYHQGKVAGVYRKNHPAIRQSVYQAGTEAPVFSMNGLTFGVLICNDSNYPELSKKLARNGATTLFIPTNNGLPPAKANVVQDTARCDSQIAISNRVNVVRADVAGEADNRVSFGSSSIVSSSGMVLQTGARMRNCLLVADLADLADSNA